ncbi:putative glyoxylase [Chytridium lagenaria]|nr:putative glyoxylase [Chytridium lagenaria]
MTIPSTNPFPPPPAVTHAPSPHGILGHLSISVKDLHASAAFYDAILPHVGLTRVCTSPHHCIGYGVPGGGEKFMLKPAGVEDKAPEKGFHVAFNAGSREAVDAFYWEAMRCGGRCEGAVGERPRFGKNYYAGFVRDLDGWKIEVVHQDF